jgi:hypothetical protein
MNKHIRKEFITLQVDQSSVHKEYKPLNDEQRMNSRTYQKYDLP